MPYTYVVAAASRSGGDEQEFEVAVVRSVFAPDRAQPPLSDVPADVQAALRAWLEPQTPDV